MRTPNSRDLAEQLAAVLVNHHHACLPADEHTVIRRVGHDVVPASVAAQDERARDLVLQRSLPGHRDDHRHN
jgi:hypothetical protein